MLSNMHVLHIETPEWFKIMYSVFEEVIKYAIPVHLIYRMDALRMCLWQMTLYI